jgi:hypothetical protein
MGERKRVGGGVAKEARSGQKSFFSPSLRCYLPLYANLRVKFPAQGSDSCTPRVC